MALAVAVVVAALFADVTPSVATEAEAESSDAEQITTTTPGGGTDLVALERLPDGTYLASEIKIGADLSGLEVLGAKDLIAVEQEIIFQAFFDPERANQWALDRTTFEAASASVGSASAIVAVIDTGILGTHEDLGGVLLPGFDFVLGTGDGLVADNFHGSHVAGIVAANVNNNLGIAGAGDSLRVLPVRVLNGAGSGSSAAVANGIIWAADQGADVINLSLGSTSNSLVVESAVDYAVSKGVVVVAAAGNSGALRNPIIYPAALDNVVSVAAIASDSSRAGFSGYGSWVDITAPGVSIRSLDIGSDASYAYASGTSMATPYVAAAAGLLRAADPSLTVVEIRNLLNATAEDLGPAGRDDDFGYGLVDPAAALAAIGTDPDGGVYPPPDSGYSFVTSLGRVLSQGLASDLGSLAHIELAQPVVAAVDTPSGNGYWMVASDGGIFAFGDAGFYGSTGAIPLAQPVVGMASTPTGNGYWLVASDGGIFAFGDAAFHGSAGAIAVAQPVVGMAATPTGNGYWLVASDGGIFAYGDAAFHGSTGALPLVEPIVGMAATPTGNGYWLVASDGGIFAFGDATFHGSAGAIALTQPVITMSPTPGLYGYWLTAADGGIFGYGDARYAGSAAGKMLPDETVVSLIDAIFS